MLIYVAHNGEDLKSLMRCVGLHHTCNKTSAGAEISDRLIFMEIFASEEKVIARSDRYTPWAGIPGRYKNSSGDEIANVLVNDDIAHT